MSVKVKGIKFFQAIAGKIDKEKGLISGVSVITMGEAKGHGMMIDYKSLDQVMVCAGKYPNGLKVALDHYSGIEAIVGYLTGFNLSGDKLRADLHLLGTHPKREYILELAETIPDNFGISIAFSGEHEEKEGIMYARCSEIYSADLVMTPAANEGLFQKPTQTVDKPNITLNQEQNPMNIEDIKKLLDETLKPVTARLEALEKKPEVKADVAPALTKEDVGAIMAETFSKLKISPVAPVITEPAPAPVKKNFDQFCAELEAKGVKKSDAVKAMYGSKNKEHQEAVLEYREKTLGFQTRKGQGPSVTTILN